MKLTKKLKWLTIASTFERVLPGLKIHLILMQWSIANVFSEDNTNEIVFLSQDLKWKRASILLCA